LIEENAVKFIRERRNQIFKSTKNFQAESYDLAALGFSVMTLQHWVFQL